MSKAHWQKCGGMRPACPQFAAFKPFHATAKPRCGHGGKRSRYRPPKGSATLLDAMGTATSISGASLTFGQIRPETAALFGREASHPRLRFGLARALHEPRRDHFPFIRSPSRCSSCHITTTTKILLHAFPLIIDYRFITG